MSKISPTPSLSRRDLLRLSLWAGAGLSWGGWESGLAFAGQDPAPAPAARPSAARSGRYLDAAVQAARWIRSARVATPDGYVWLHGPERPEGLSIDANLYHGGAGVLLFLAQLGRVTGDASYLEEVSRGADALIAGLPEALTSPTQEGLYTGVAGIGFALEQAHQATGKAEHRQGGTRCRDLLLKAARPVPAEAEGIERAEWGELTDIIMGAAGAGLYLLDRARQLDDIAALRLAVKVGHRLVELGIPEAGGLKWKMGASLPKTMPNFSHGTAGVAYFLAALYQNTGHQGFLDAALAGARYLQAVADTSGDGCRVFHNDENGKDLYYLGWCHGPAGTVRLFHQLGRITQDPAWDGWVKRGARSILKSGIPEKRTPGFWNNAGQCCGDAGVADFFLRLHRLHKDPESLAFAKRIADDLLRRATPTPGGGLKWVQAEHRAKPEYTYAQTGLMQGAAGIGLMLLHLDAVERGQAWDFRLPDSPF
jgi:lantibiotic modifying enzyme